MNSSEQGGWARCTGTFLSHPSVTLTTIDLASFAKGVEDRWQRLGVRRSPVHDIAAVASGIPMEGILASYPSLSHGQVELAALYAEANPASAAGPVNGRCPPSRCALSVVTGAN